MYGPVLGQRHTGVLLSQRDMARRSSLEEQAQKINDEISPKFIIDPSKPQLLHDLCIALKRFRNACRRREFMHRKSRGDLTEEEVDNPGYWDEEEKGMETGLYSTRRIFVWRRGSDNLESFLSHLERDLISDYGSRTANRQPNASGNKRFIANFMSDLGQAPQTVILRTDKTGKFMLFPLQEYCRQICWLI